MWYECLPPLMIILTCTTIPNFVSPYITKFFTGTPNLRSYTNFLEQELLMRDIKLSNNWYIYNGLEVIPDK
ncbi:PREDICTED: NADH dehydrogenase [ubiquinone] 1 alpha subcomplex subunit 1 [Habropoda laboriosa]|uniref:NADH dehydrogenase [ubiquinone] 1 alpha subcomplex subunit 1 n=1 Tax=Habropoda laboriosa TaxID=597456 RepID=UPI00083DF88A|nr:PREDICTED: NADH dehydrogenase [ubiquinone] 1 alpha subcomplex subunit 1 [Habropoda laboriosa]